jgi:hypothetical protein
MEHLPYGNNLQIEKMRQEALEISQQKERLAGSSETVDESVQLVEALKEELATLKDMYSRQFVASKQELDDAHARIRQLRKQIGGNATPLPRAHNGVAPPSENSGGSVAVTQPGRADAPVDGRNPPSADASDFSAWASELITKVSRTPHPGVCRTHACRLLWCIST